jgi:hypothetical protein
VISPAPAAGAVISDQITELNRGGKNMDILQLIGLLAPVFLTLIVQGLKKLMGLNGYVAIAVVFIIGGISALIGVGPTPGAGWVDTTVNAGWIVGVATFIYSIFKKRSA